jgi:hypothetical protein
MWAQRAHGRIRIEGRRAARMGCKQLKVLFVVRGTHVGFPNVQVDVQMQQEERCGEGGPSRHDPSVSAVAHVAERREMMLYLSSNCAFASAHFTDVPCPGPAVTMSYKGQGICTMLHILCSMPQRTWGPVSPPKEPFPANTGIHPLRQQLRSHGNSSMKSSAALTWCIMLQ